MQDLSKGGAQLSNFGDFEYTCREASCREQRSKLRTVARGFGGMAPRKF